MTRDPLAQISTRTTPQSQQADPRQVPNSAGGFTFALGALERLRRFLVLGVDGGTYYVKPRELALDNAQVVIDLTSTAESHRALVDEVVAVSEEGRAPRQQPALFALAVAASHGTAEARRYALDRLSRVARTGTHLFQFVTYVEQFRGHGRQLNRALGEWYLGRSVEDLAYQAVKYRRRLDWTHRDVLRKARPRRPPNTYWRGELFDWIVGRPTDLGLGVGVGQELLPTDSPLRLVEGFERVQRATGGREAAALIREYRLSWEMLPDAVLNSTHAWEALLETGVPQTALLRQLPRLTRLGMLTPQSPWTSVVVNQLGDTERLRRSRVHPLSVLVALRTYASGRSDRGTSTWVPSRPVIDGLDAAFYAAFGAVRSTGRRLLLALDVSGSMANSRIADTPLTPREASAALALVTVATEKSCDVVGFTSGTGARSCYDAALSPLAISPRQRLDDAIRTVSHLPFGGTDCALPMLYALRHNLQVDAFVIYTDNETWAGSVHPHEALRRYRDQTGVPAKLIVVGMTSTGFTIADPSDAGSLDVVGFDTATPQLISDFARGDAE